MIRTIMFGLVQFAGLGLAASACLPLGLEGGYTDEDIGQYARVTVDATSPGALMGGIDPNEEIDYRIFDFRKMQELVDDRGLPVQFVGPNVVSSRPGIVSVLPLGRKRWISTAYEPETRGCWYLYEYQTEDRPQGGSESKLVSPGYPCSAEGARGWVFR